jgi:hypothetical protein
LQALFLQVSVALPACRRPGMISATIFCHSFFCLCLFFAKDSTSKETKDHIAMNQAKNISRREFIQHSTALGAGMMLAGANRLFAVENSSNNIASKGYAARLCSSEFFLYILSVRFFILGHKKVIVL